MLNIDFVYFFNVCVVSKQTVRWPNILR